MSVRYTARLAKAGIAPDVGSVGGSADHGFTETKLSVFKAEVIHCRDPWRRFDVVEYAPLALVEWFNNRHLQELIGNLPPATAEAKS